VTKKPAKTTTVLPGVFGKVKGLILGVGETYNKNDRFWQSLYESSKSFDRRLG
jgi:hypothetical protein